MESYYQPPNSVYRLRPVEPRHGNKSYILWPHISPISTPAKSTTSAFPASIPPAPHNTTIPAPISLIRKILCGTCTRPAAQPTSEKTPLPQPWKTPISKGWITIFYVHIHVHSSSRIAHIHKQHPALIRIPPQPPISLFQYHRWSDYSAIPQSHPPNR